MTFARTAGTTRPRRRTTQQRVRPTVQRILDAMTGAPAFVRNGRLDVLAPNTLVRALYAPMYDDPARPVNMARFLFLGQRATEFWIDWETAAKRHRAPPDRSRSRPLRQRFV